MLRTKGHAHCAHGKTVNGKVNGKRPTARQTLSLEGARRARCTWYKANSKVKGLARGCWAPRASLVASTFSLVENK